MLFKCKSCAVFVETENTSAVCPECKNEMVEACKNDCVCNHQNVPGIKKCDICGEYVCPECGGHDVIPQSRVTGYLGPVTAWNAGKQQELIDRQSVVI